MEKESATVFSLEKYRNIRNQALYYWNMTKCNYLELSRQSRVTPERAKMWELKFIKLNKARKENG